MGSPAEIVAAVFGVVVGSFVVWGVVRVVNDRRNLRLAVPAAVVAACLWLPFSWLLLMQGGWDGYHVSWLKMWSFLPGFIPGAVLFHPRHELLEFSTMAVTTLMLLVGLTRLASRSRRGLIVAAVIALMISIPTAWVAYGAYYF